MPRFAAIKTKALIQGTAGLQPFPDVKLIEILATIEWRVLEHRATKQEGAERYEKAKYLSRDLAHRRMHIVS
jgi:hypothetical protein